MQNTTTYRLEYEIDLTGIGVISGFLDYDNAEDLVDKIIQIQNMRGRYDFSVTKTRTITDGKKRRKITWGKGYNHAES